MKMLFVESYPQALYGQQRTLLAMLERCPEMGIEPIVAVTGGGQFTDHLLKLGISLEKFSYPEHLNRYGGAIYRDGVFKRLTVLRQAFGYIAGIRKQLKRLRPAVVYCNDMRALLTAGVAAKMLRIPVVIWDKLDKPHGLLDWFQLPLVSKNIIISNAVAKKYPAVQNRFFKKKIEKVSDGVDLDCFNVSSDIRGELGLNASDIVMVMAGSITERKAPDRILVLLDRLLEKHPDLHLLFAGAVPDNDIAESYCNDLPNRNHSHVHFLGERSDLPDVLHSADMLLLPSRYEGLGLVAVEAMAARLPVVGANTGGISEVVVDGKTGFIVEGDDSDAWVEAISKLAASAELRRKMGEAGRERVEKHFNRPVLMRQVLELCKSVAR